MGQTRKGCRRPYSHSIRGRGCFRGVPAAWSDDAWLGIALKCAYLNPLAIHPDSTETVMRKYDCGQLVFCRMNKNFRKRATVHGVATRWTLLSFNSAALCTGSVSALGTHIAYCCTICEELRAMLTQRRTAIKHTIDTKTKALITAHTNARPNSQKKKTTIHSNIPSKMLEMTCDSEQTNRNTSNWGQLITETDATPRTRKNNNQSPKSSPGREA